MTFTHQANVGVASTTIYLGATGLGDDCACPTHCTEGTAKFCLYCESTHEALRKDCSKTELYSCFGFACNSSTENCVERRSEELYSAKLCHDENDSAGHEKATLFAIIGEQSFQPNAPARVPRRAEWREIPAKTQLLGCSASSDEGTENPNKRQDLDTSYCKPLRCNWGFELGHIVQFEEILSCQQPRIS